MANQVIETSWGGGSGIHSPIVLDPINTQNDLILKSEVYVQSFLSLQRHEYHYKAENGSHSSGANCGMRVQWIGPKITWSYVPPGVPMDHVVQSFFSPQRMATTADADVLAGLGTACKARSVRGEQADAYIPWASGVPGLFRSVWPLLKHVLVPGGAAAVLSASMAWGAHESIEIMSSVHLINPQLKFEYSVVNRKDVMINGLVDGVDELVRRRFEIPPGQSENWTFESSRCPAETTASIEYQVPGWENLGATRLPICMLVPEG